MLKLILYEDAVTKALTFPRLITGTGSERCSIFIKCVETRTTGDESVYSRETESIGCVCVCVCVWRERERDFNKSAHVIMGLASLNLQSRQAD